MDAVHVIEQIEQDFTEQQPPFDDIEFPEQRLLEEAAVIAGESDEPISFSMEDTLRLISMFATFDYNRDANQLANKLLVVQRQEPSFFDPWHVNGSGELAVLLEEIGTRYPVRDATAWAKNCRILRQQYHGRWTELLLDTGLDAVNLVERLDKDDFNCLKGDKIAPMYCRIISDEVAELDRLWELDIAVDVHIRRLSKELFQMDDNVTDDEIRDRWYLHAVSNDFSRHIVDGGLWQIGSNWDQWGEDYWNDVLEAADD